MSLGSHLWRDTRLVPAREVMRSQAQRRSEDWHCPCGEVVFASRSECRKCNRPNPDARDARDARSSASGGGRPGDWRCACGELVFATRSECRKCGAKRLPLTASAASAVPPVAPVRAATTSAPAQLASEAPQAVVLASAPAGRAGDWTCPTCGDHVYSVRAACRQCGTPNPDGRWNCRLQTCKQVNQASADRCVSCSAAKNVPTGDNCVVCISQTKTWMFDDCGHAVYCDDCSKNETLRRQCPMCRGASVLRKVFL
jgi:hypothetical protein